MKWRPYGFQWRVGDFFNTLLDCVHTADGHRELRSVPRDLRLVVGGATRYRLVGGLCRTLGELKRAHGDARSPFEWVGLMNRYRARRARLTVIGLPGITGDAFASVTDLGTGRERPWPIERRDDATIVVDHPACPARTLLRVYWPLRRSATESSAVGAARRAAGGDY